MGAARLGSNSYWVLAAMLALACSGLSSGASRPLPVAEMGGMSTEATRVGTNQIDGPRVLWNAMALGDASERSWVANDPVELAVLWREAGPTVAMPEVDFARYVVFGVSHWGSYCQPEISGVTVERSGVVRLNAEEDTRICLDVGVRVSLVIALPRRLLKDKALLVAPEYAHAFEFSVPSVPPANATKPSPLPRASATVASRLSPVPLPAAGHLALATLRDGSEVWVAHDSSGALSVVSAVSSLRPWLLSGFPEYLETAVQWSPELGRFVGGWDWHGRNTQGFAPLRPHGFQLDSQGQLWVGNATEAIPGPIRPRKDAPQLDGAARAYTTLRHSTWRDLREGAFAIVELDLVSLPSLGVALCEVPKQTAPLAHFRCPNDAPRVLGAPEHPRAPPFVLRGPFVVQRTARGAQVIVISGMPQKALLGE